MALATLEYVKTVLNITDSALNAQLSLLIESASAEIKRYLGLEIEEKTFTEYHTGKNTVSFALRQIPVISMTGLWLHSGGYYDTGTITFGSETLLVEGRDYVLDRAPSSTLSKSGIIYRIGTVWPMLHRVATFNRLSTDLGPAWGNIKVAYTAGYNPVPEDIQFATALLVSRMRLTAPYGGYMLGSEKIGDYAYGLANPRVASKYPEFGTIQALLAPYKEMGW